MFGRNRNGYYNSNQPPLNNGSLFAPQVFQQGNIFNFQIQNQNYYNYQQNTQQFTGQTQHNYQQFETNNIQNTNAPDFDQFLNESQQYSEHSIAESSKKTYNSSISVYEEIMRTFQKEPYPITVEKLKVFITYQAKNGISLNTLKSYITGISFYFRSNDFPNLTLTNDFKKFKAGLERAFKDDNSPNAKLPFKIEYFIRLLELYDMSQIENARLMFCMTLSFFAFLRISELYSLRKSDIIFDAPRNKLIINIRYSKTDQTGHGITTYLYNNNHKIYHPINFIGFNYNLKDDDPIVNITQDNFRKKLNNALEKLGLEKEKYSWHSFRRGGATLASQNHIDPAIIKTHGRWLSEAYLLYVDRDQDSAGLQISDVL